MENVKSLLNTYLGLIFKAGITLVILSTLFLFTNLTTEFYDTPKFLSLLAFTSILLILLTLGYTVKGKVVLTRTPLDIPFLLLLAVGIVSTVLSSSPFVALLGNQLKIHGSLASLTAYILFYFVLVNSLKTNREVKWILYLTLVAGQILAVISLLAFFGVKLLPPPWTYGINFTPTGSSFSTTAVLALLIPFAVSQIFSETKLAAKIINALFLTLMGVTIALTGSLPIWIVASLAFFATFILENPIKDVSKLFITNPINLVSITIPLILTILIAVLSFIPPIGGAKNPIYTQAQNFPREIQADFVTSWKVSVSAFRDMPFWGTGPATYLFNFTNYKPIEFNSSKQWNLRFDSSFNEYLQVLATLGGVGLLALLSLTALFTSSAFSVLKNQSSNSMKKSLAISGLCFFLILALHPSTLVLWVIGTLILASFFVLNISDGLQKSWSATGDLKSTFFKVASNFSSIHSSQETIRIEALPSILLTAIVGLSLAVFFFSGKFVLADYHHRMALNAIAQNNGIVAYNELVAAEKWNNLNDLYHTDLAQVNFALANAIASAKGPTEASPAGSLTDQDKQNIQVLLQQSINEGRLATTLAPRSATNWEILGLLYRQISGVAENALVFSLDSYGRAIFQDPLNPQLRLNVGGVYYAIKSYDMAIRFFTDSINLKPDFANGYYNLSVALRDKGDLANALTAGEKVVELVEKDSSDYKIATDYVNDLKNKINPAAPITPPAAQTTGALQEEKLPKVVNVGNPPTDIATPSAVKKPTPTPTPAQ